MLSTDFHEIGVSLMRRFQAASIRVSFIDLDVPTERKLMADRDLAAHFFYFTFTRLQEKSTLQKNSMLVSRVLGHPNDLHQTTVFYLLLNTFSKRYEELALIRKMLAEDCDKAQLELYKRVRKEICKSIGWKESDALDGVKLGHRKWIQIIKAAELREKVDVIGSYLMQRSRNAGNHVNMELKAVELLSQLIFRKKDKGIARRTTKDYLESMDKPKFPPVQEESVTEVAMRYPRTQKQIENKLPFYRLVPDVIHPKELAKMQEKNRERMQAYKQDSEDSQTQQQILYQKIIKGMIEHFELSPLSRKLKRIDTPDF